MANAPDDKKPLEITTPCSTLVQGNVTFLLFGMSALAFATMASPKRFSEDPENGVQRDLIESQVNGFMATMRAGDPIPSAVVVNLTGWIVESGQVVGIEGDSFVECLDGQQRGEAVNRLIAAGEEHVAARYSVPVMAVMDASDDLRRALFMSQVKARHISREHAATMRYKSGDYPSVYNEESGRVAGLLDSRDDSPLMGRVHFGDLLRGPRNSAVLPEGKWVTFASLERTVLEAVVGRRAVGASLSSEGRVQFAIDLLSAAKECYPTQFEPGGALRTAFGIRALFLLAARKESGFRTRLQDAGCAKAEMLRLMRMVPRFHWAAREGSMRTPASVVARFNERLNIALLGSRRS